MGFSSQSDGVKLEASHENGVFCFVLKQKLPMTTNGVQLNYTRTEYLTGYTPC
jgi:hypothetical protein